MTTNLQSLESTQLTDAKQEELDNMIQILQKPTVRRNEQDLQELVPYMKEIHFFKERDIKNTDMMDIVSSLLYEKFDQDEVIC